jgi:hypothetical protein
MTNVKDYLRNMRQKMIQVSPLDPGTRDPKTGSSEGRERGNNKPAADGNNSPSLDGLRYEAPQSNEDPMRKRIHSYKNKYQRRWARFRKWAAGMAAWTKTQAQILWHHRPWRELTPEEKRQREENQRRKQMRGVLMDEAREYKKRIRNALTRRGLCYKKRQYERDFLDAMMGISLDEVKFDHVVLQPDAIYFRVNTSRLPHRVGILDLVDEDIVTDLSIACRHRVTAQYTEKIGVWYVVERATGVRGIPRHVRWQEVWEQMPSTAGKYAIPMGLTVNSKFVHRDLAAMTHALVAGTTGYGKSNMMHIMLLTLMLRNDPRSARFILVDLKGGMEMHFYEDVPHLLKLDGITETGIIYNRDQVPDALECLVTEGERRMSKIKAAGYQNIEDYNHRKKKDRLPRIFLFIDEWADIRLVGGLGVKAERSLSNVATRMRAVGIHIVLGTQQPKKQVISTLIKSNLPAKFGFACANNTASILILDHGGAADISEKGRYIYKHGGDELEIQAPYVSTGQIRELVAAIREGADEVNLRGHDITARELFEYAIDEHDGELKINVIYERFKGRVGHTAMNQWLMELDGSEHEIRGNAYQVIPPAGPHPRHLELIE